MKTVLAVASSILTAALLLPAGAAAAKPMPGGRIAFVGSKFDGQGIAHPTQIYSVRPDGSGLHQLTHDTSFVLLGPSWSPDGKDLAFTNLISLDETGELFVMRADGSDERQVPTPGLGTGFNPAWSPDGHRLVFIGSANPDSTRNVYTIGVDGQGLQQLTDFTPDVSPLQTAWSPTANLIAFTEIVAMPSGSSREEIFVMRPDGTGVVQLTNGGLGSRDPDFSPDGRSVIFTHVSDSGDLRIQTIDLASHRITTLNPDPAHDIGSDPSFSPDGRQVVLETDPPFRAAVQLTRLSLDTGKLTKVLPKPDFEESSPSWQPSAAAAA